MTWKSENFIRYETQGLLIMDQLKNFLNEHKITEFVVVVMRDNYIEIVYKK